jgi:hypothetical protein
MKRLPLEEREKGRRAVARFIKYWAKKEALSGNSRVQKLDCRIELRFNWFGDELTKECRTNIMLYPRSGRLWVDDSEWFTDPWVHQEYDPIYQKYRWRKKAKVLRIYGQATQKGYTEYRLTVGSLSTPLPDRMQIHKASEAAAALRRVDK